MSGKNHKIVDGRLIQTDKPFSQLKQKQKKKINEQLYQEYRRLYVQNGIAPDGRYHDNILSAVYEQINNAEIWLPFAELKKCFLSHKNKYRKRYEKEVNKVGK